MCVSQGGYPPTRPRLRGFWNLFHYVNSSKKGLQNRHSYAIIRGVPSQILGCRQAVRHQTLTLAFVGSNPAIPAKSDPLAQLAEQLPFKQWVRGSNPRRVTRKSTLRRAFSLISEDQRPFEIKDLTVCCAHALAACGLLSSARFLIRRHPAVV